MIKPLHKSCNILPYGELLIFLENGISVYAVKSMFSPVGALTFGGTV
jgi:hypothetical protein